MSPAAQQRDDDEPTGSAEQAKQPTKLRVVPAQYVQCRIWGHAWDYTTVKRDGRKLVQGLRCMRCTTERYVNVDGRTGERLSNNYAYPDNYQLHGGGQLTPKERARIRIRDIKSHFNDG